MQIKNSFYETRLDWIKLILLIANVNIYNSRQPCFCAAGTYINVWCLDQVSERLPFNPEEDIFICNDFWRT